MPTDKHLGLRGVGVVVVAVVSKERKTAQFFSLRRAKSAVGAVLKAIFDSYGFSVPADSYWEDAGSWISVKALSPLHAAADKALKKWLKTLVYRSGNDISQAAEALLKLPTGSIRVHKGVTYEGYTNRLLKTHSFSVVTKLIEQARVLVKESWSWEPNDLRVLTHNQGKAMGIAYAPGKGIHRISLHTKLLNEYDEMSIFRVIIHELCHHYREEKWPRELTMANAHDERFCEALTIVDPLVKDNPKECTYFTDEQWEGSSVVQKKKEALSASRYEPGRGTFVLRLLKSGHLRLDWVGEDFNKRGIKVSERELKALTKDMTKEQQERLLITHADRRGQAALDNYLTRWLGDAKITVKPTFWNFLEGLEARYPQLEGLAK